MWQGSSRIPSGRVSWQWKIAHWYFICLLKMQKNDGLSEFIIIPCNNKNCWVFSIFRHTHTFQMASGTTLCSVSVRPLPKMLWRAVPTPRPPRSQAKKDCFANEQHLFIIKTYRVCEKGININNQYFCKFITKSQNKKKRYLTYCIPGELFHRACIVEGTHA